MERYLKFPLIQLPKELCDTSIIEAARTLGRVSINSAPEGALRLWTVKQMFSSGRFPLIQLPKELCDMAFGLPTEPFYCVSINSAPEGALRQAMFDLFGFCIEFPLIQLPKELCDSVEYVLRALLEEFPLIQLPKELCDPQNYFARAILIVAFPLIQLPKELCDSRALKPAPLLYSRPVFREPPTITLKKPLVSILEIDRKAAESNPISFLQFREPPGIWPPLVVCQNWLSEYQLSFFLPPPCSDA